MKNLQLRLKGFIGIKKGLGLDEISVDLSGMSGLIALSGPNGHGKTSILDNLQPFRTLPSRKRAIKNHVFLRDSEKEFSFKFNGDEFRTLVKIDAQSERSEGYIWVNGSGKSLVDGKAGQYDAAIREIFGSQELFVNSVFCAQGSKKLNEMRKGELQGLFAEFLRLFKYQEWEKTSGTASTILMSKVDEVCKEMDSQRKVLSEENRVRDEIHLLESKKTTAIKDIEILKGGKKSTEDEIKRLEKAEAQNDLLRESVKASQATEQRIAKEVEDIKNEGGIEIKGLRDEKHQCGLEIISLDSILENEAEIREAAKEAEITEGETEVMEASLSVARDDLDKRIEGVKVAERVSSNFEYNAQKEVGHQTTDIKLLKNRIESTEKLAAGLDARDPECTSTICSFIVDSLAAAKLLPSLKKELSESEEWLKNLKTDHEKRRELFTGDIKKVKELLSEADNHYKKILKEVERLKSNLATQKRLAKDLPRVEVAVSKKEAFQRQLADLSKKIDERIEFWNGLFKRKKNELEETKQNTLKLHADIIEDADKKLAAVRKELEAVESNIVRMAETEIPAIEAGLQRVKNELSEIEKTKQEYDKKSAVEGHLINEVADWSYLKAACGKDGLRNLEISSVAPVISGYANDLLTSTFGPAFTVKFRTQDEESMREVFDILVIGEDGSETLLDELSGGERVWILKALRLALTLISKEKGGIDFQTALSDEEDGALDVENAKNFIRLYRSFMAEGNFEDCYFISHKPQAIAMADHIMQFQNGGISIE